MAVVPVADVTWRTSVLCRNCEDGWINGPYLCGFLVHGRLALGSRDLDQQNGVREWNNQVRGFPERYLRAGTTKIRIEGVPHLLHSFNHGFNSNFPDVSKQFLISFLRLLPGGLAVSANVQSYYAKCAAFMTPPEHLGSPPSYLDLFKDTRIKKTWVLPDSYQKHFVVIDTPNMLQIWPDLMVDSWNSIHSWRDASVTWMNLQPVIDDYHNSLGQNTSWFLRNRIKNM